MSLTFQQIILDAKKLVGRISDEENEADNLICEIQSICSQIDGMKQVNNFNHLFWKFNVMMLIFLYTYMIILKRRAHFTEFTDDIWK